MSKQFLQLKWNKLMEQSDIDQAKGQIYFDELCHYYSETHRAYHNLSHIQALFQLLKPYEEELKHPILVNWAVFYHDIIYNPKRKDNELKSAEVAVEVMKNVGFKKQEQELVFGLIMATKDHKATANTADFYYLLDADIAILGSELASYQQYSQAIRQEYKHVPGFLYRIGRKKALKHLAQKTPFFYTHVFRAQFEEQAKKNITWELSTL